MIPPFALIVTAAGSSERFSKDDVKKEFLKLDGHTVLYRATEPFFELPGLVAVVITCKKGTEDEAIVALEDLVDVGSVPMLFTEGGDSRQESVHLALEKLASISIPFEYVAIQDGARPYTTPDLIIRTLAAATTTGGAIPALPMTDSIRRINAQGEIIECIDRRGVVRVQTPQIFSFLPLLEAHRRAQKGVATDDAELFIKSGNRCVISEGDEKNIKITYIEDIPNAKEQIEEYIKEREEGRKTAKAVHLFQSFVQGES